MPNNLLVHEEINIGIVDKDLELKSKLMFLVWGSSLLISFKIFYFLLSKALEYSDFFKPEAVTQQQWMLI